MAHLFDGDGEMRRREHWRTIGVFDGDVGGVQRPDMVRKRLQAIGLLVGAGQYGLDAWHHQGHRGVYGVDARMGMRRAQKEGVELPRRAEVIAEAAAAGHQAKVFLAGDSGANSGHLGGEVHAQAFRDGVEWWRHACTARRTISPMTWARYSLLAKRSALRAP